MSKESSKKRVILFVVLVIVVLACGLYYWNAYLSKNKIDLSKNMTVHYIGISGLASIDYVDYHFDEETTNRYQNSYRVCPIKPTSHPIFPMAKA